MAIASPFILAILLAAARRGSRHSIPGISWCLLWGHSWLSRTCGHGHLRKFDTSRRRSRFWLRRSSRIPTPDGRVALLWLLPMIFLALWAAYWTADTSRRFKEDGRSLAGLASTCS